jgi:Spy/CpxP family protein refolding chaperone
MNNRRMAILYLAGVFLAGALAGGFGGYKLGRRPTFRPPNPQSMADHWIGNLRRDLSLSDDQVVKVRPVIEAATAEADTIHAATWERTHGVISNTNRRIEPFLTLEQRQKLAEKERRRSDRFRQKGPPAPGPKPGSEASGPPPPP